MREEYSHFAERDDEPYYSVSMDADKVLCAQCEVKVAAKPNTVSGGRLGTHEYYNTYSAINAALTACEEQIVSLLKKQIVVSSGD